MNNMTCGFTGYRPAKLPFQDEADIRCIKLKQTMRRWVEALSKQGYERFITGMALGSDQYRSMTGDRAERSIR